MNLPNLLTLARIVLVPLVIWLIISGRLDVAFAVLVVAGLTDALDGFLAKRFGWQTELGAYLDPLADKLLLAGTYVTLGALGNMPAWLVILVVSRDVMIVAAILLSALLGQPLDIRPHPVSKLNTAAQIALALLVLADDGFAIGLGLLRDVAVGATALLTAVSAGTYLLAWIRHMAGGSASGHDGAS